MGSLPAYRVWSAQLEKYFPVHKIDVVRGRIYIDDSGYLVKDCVLEQEVAPGKWRRVDDLSILAERDHVSPAPVVLGYKHIWQCPVCGCNPVETWWKFCPRCGKRIANVESSGQHI